MEFRSGIDSREISFVSIDKQNRFRGRQKLTPGQPEAKLANQMVCKICPLLRGLMPLLDFTRQRYLSSYLFTISQGVSYNSAKINKQNSPQCPGLLLKQFSLFLSLSDLIILSESEVVIRRVTNKSYEIKYDVH